MKFLIIAIMLNNHEHRYEFSEEVFCKRLTSFLTLYVDKEKGDKVLTRYKLAIKSNAPFLFQQDGFKFIVLPERR